MLYEVICLPAVVVGIVAVCMYIVGRDVIGIKYVTRHLLCCDPHVTFLVATWQPRLRWLVGMVVALPTFAVVGLVQQGGAPACLPSIFSYPTIYQPPPHYDVTTIAVVMLISCLHPSCYCSRSRFNSARSLPREEFRALKGAERKCGDPPSSRAARCDFCARSINDDVTRGWASKRRRSDDVTDQFSQFCLSRD